MTVEKTAEKPENFHIEVSRDGAGVTLITLRSRRLEAMMREWANAKTFKLSEVASPEAVPATGLSTDQRFYKFATDPALPSGRRWGAPHAGVVLNPGNNPSFNMRYFALVGLGDGITVRLGVPLSRSMITAIVESAAEAAEELLGEFAKPVKLSSTITAKESKETV